LSSANTSHFILGCGIVGIAGDIFYKEERTMQALFLADYLRGTDSTGLAAVRNNGDVKIAKLASDPITLFQMTQFKNALNGNNSKLFLGHNRASTSGSTTNYNAHPYQFGHIVGVQNGTLAYGDQTMLEEILDEKYEVDSQALFACIAKIGVKDTVSMLKEGATYDRGAWALVWYDMKEDTINFLRNKHRPMWMAWDEGFKRLFFASQWRMLDYASDMASSPYKWEIYERKEEPGKFYRFFQLPENQHWKFNLDEMRKGSKSRPKPIVREIKGREPAPAAKKPVYDPFPVRGNIQTTPQPSSTTTSHLGTNRRGEKLIHFTATPDEPYANVIGMMRFAELTGMSGNGTQTGCSFCYADIPYGSPGITVYEEQDTILCRHCSGHGPGEELPAAKVYVSSKDFETLQKKAA
jgi:hypothetical protein